MVGTLLFRYRVSKLDSRAKWLALFSLGCRSRVYNNLGGRVVRGDQGLEIRLGIWGVGCRARRQRPRPPFWGLKLKDWGVVFRVGPAGWGLDAVGMKVWGVGLGVKPRRRQPRPP